jgi:hypothetical protein
MISQKLSELKGDLNRIKVKKNEKEKVKTKKERDSIEAEIQFFTNKMITDYELMKYDPGIKMESYNTNFFIFDVEGIVRKLEDEKSKTCP